MPPSLRDAAAGFRRRTLPLAVAGDLRTAVSLARWSRIPDGQLVDLRLRPLRPHPFRMRAGRDPLGMLSDAFIWRYHLPPTGLGELRCIWDLGANVGATAADLARRNPGAQVVAVEADPSTCALAEQNLRPWHVDVRCGAIWPHPGSVRLAVDPADSQVARVGESGLEVPAISPGDLPTGPDGTVDYVKLDIESAESEVLRDAPWLKAVRAIKVEVHAPYTVERCERDLNRQGMRTARDRSHWATVIGLSA